MFLLHFLGENHRVTKLIHQLSYGFHRGPILRPRYHFLTPNFGKTAGFLKSPALAGGYGGAKGFSEIGGRGQGPGVPIALVSQRLMDI